MVRVAEPDADIMPWSNREAALAYPSDDSSSDDSEDPLYDSALEARQGLRHSRKARRARRALPRFGTIHGTYSTLPYPHGGSIHASQHALGMRQATHRHYSRVRHPQTIEVRPIERRRQRCTTVLALGLPWHDGWFPTAREVQ
jgi:hypothetical protein